MDIHILCDSLCGRGDSPMHLHLIILLPHFTIVSIYYHKNDNENGHNDTPAINVIDLTFTP